MSNGSGFVKETAMDERFDREEETRVKIFSDEKTGEDLNEDDIIYGIDEENPSEAGHIMMTRKTMTILMRKKKKKRSLLVPYAEKRLTFSLKRGS